jgi:hypothetical protein
MNETNLSRVVVVCDTQPLAIEGIRSLISQNEGLSFAGGSPVFSAEWNWCVR